MDFASLMRGPSRMTMGRGPMGGQGSPAGAGAQPMQSAASEVEKVGRNELCPCGSGKKYKKCHGASA
jgi:preprotein translocase subunit SecA